MFLFVFLHFEDFLWREVVLEFFASFSSFLFFKLKDFVGGRKRFLGEENHFFFFLLLVWEVIFY